MREVRVAQGIGRVLQGSQGLFGDRRGVCQLRGTEGNEDVLQDGRACEVLEVRPSQGLDRLLQIASSITRCCPSFVMSSEISNPGCAMQSESIQ